MTQITLEEAIVARDAGMAIAEKSGGTQFIATAMEYILWYFEQYGPTSGEDLTDACHRAGIVPRDDRAFGPVYHKLSRQGKIVKCGTVTRRRGHLTTGGNVWCLVNSEKEHS